MSNIGNTGSTRSWSSIVKGPTTQPTSTPSTTTPPTTTTSTTSTTTSNRTTSPPTTVGSGTDQQTVQQSVSSQSSTQIQSTSQQVPKIKALSEDESGESVQSTPPLDFGSLLNRGRISESDLLSMVPDGVRDTFYPSGRISEGSKFSWSQDGHDYEVKYHSPDRGAPPGNSRNGWTAQITVDGQLMTQRGMFRSRPCNFTHIPLDN